MFGTIVKVVKILHSILLSVALLVVFPSLGLFLYEQSRTFDHYMKYYHAVPYTTTYKDGETVKFYSFYQSFHDVDVEWSETVWCNTGSGFESLVTTSKGEIDFTVPQEYPPEIEIILDDIYQQNSINGDIGAVSNAGVQNSTDEILREYAHESNEEGFTRGTPISAWTLNMKRPLVGSSCHTRHRVQLETPYFKINKSDNFFAAPWIYGIDEAQ